MNIEAFAWYAGNSKLLARAEGTEERVAFADRAAVEFGLKKGIVAGTWAPGNLFTFRGFGPGGRELLEALLGDAALRQAVEAEFPSATSFHVKSARKFAAAWKGRAAA